MPRLPAQGIQPSAAKLTERLPWRVSAGPGQIFYSSLSEQLRIFFEHVFKLSIHFHTDFVLDLDIQIDDDRIFGCLQSNAWLARRHDNAGQADDRPASKKHDNVFWA